MASGPFPPVLMSDGAKIVLEIQNEAPIDLVDFTKSLTGLAREHEASLRRSRPSIPIEETRLLVVDVRKGSIILEMVAALAPFVTTAETVNTAADFIGNLSSAFNFLRKTDGRLPDANTQQLKNLGDTVAAIAADTNGQLKIYARHENGEVIQEFRVTKDDAQKIQNNAIAQRRELEHASTEQLRRVIMRLHQSSVDDLRVGKKTSEKGIVERIDLIPRTLIYVSDAAGRRIKNEILKPDGNPYQKGFIVDLDVETYNGRPRAYRILEVHDVIDLEEG